MGKWMSEGGTGTPHYVINPDHIARLQREGYQIIPDPRIPADINEPEQSSEAEKDEVEDDDTTRRLTTGKAANKSRTRGVDTTP